MNYLVRSGYYGDCVQRFDRFAPALRAYASLREHGIDCDILGPNHDGESDGLTEDERESVEAVP